ncbi:hypothetical protein HMPREF1076_04343 [Parabacteroides goldsteinii CL02T12C30]|uniref:Uncharacterized protein n=1 Tax=Parabacteroides goldsteinii CL02T12C30 TaxID=999418 RepID=K5Z1D7_9BACT|nr:hypothetical protein [Parabacteroides goldsteinii]EKN09314.1 hypothetical protein HMPREF1076_04343 [Parabacteroides goldsteinii CL02T12C30]
MKQIQIILYCIGLLLYVRPAAGQTLNPEDIKQVKIQVTTPSGLEKQVNVASLLKNRLTQAVVLNGTGTTCSRFLLVCYIQELSSQVTPSTPSQYISELEVSCFIADRIEKTILQQGTFQIKGIAGSKEKAVMNAVGSIRSRDPQLKKLITQGKEKIVAYYRTQCRQLMKQIESDIRREHYEEAMLQLLSVPDIDTECHDYAIALTELIDELERQQITASLEEEEPDTEWVKDKTLY